MSRTHATRRGFLRVLTAGAVAAPVVARAEALQAAVERSTRALGYRATGADAFLRLRDRYLLAPGLVYLNHASIGTTPAPVVEAHAGYLELCESHPSLYSWGGWSDVIEEVRARAAGMVGCAPDDLAITHNTTEGFSLLAQGLPLGPGDEVLFSSINHVSGAVAWDGLSAASGFSVRRFDVPVTGADQLSAEAVVALHTEAIRPATRVLVLPHIDNMIGLRHPIAEIARAARARGVEFVLVDGAQSVGMIPLDLRTSEVDAYAMSCHKWFQSPKGLGLLYLTPALRASLPRMWFKTPQRSMDGTARDYEDYSTRAWPSVVALGDALAFQAAIGAEEKDRRYRALHAMVRRRVEAEPALEWRSPSDWSLGSMIMAVQVRGRAAPDLAAPLRDDHGVDVRTFGGGLNTVRVSPNLATSDEELDRFFDVLVGMAV